MTIPSLNDRWAQTVPRLAAAALTLTLLGACGASELLGPDAEQGVEGIALRGPICPVQSLEDPCPDLPHQANVEIRTSSGWFVTTFRTGEDGRFRVGLEPGLYALFPESGEPFPVASSQEFEVVEGAYTGLTISFDTGIR